MDLVIEGNAFINGEIKNTSIGIENGKIVTIGKIVRGGDVRIDMKDRLILPGMVDPHVHFRDPGLTKKEDFRTGTMAALHAGITCVFDMPNTVPPVQDIRAMKEKKKEIGKKAYIDYGLFAALTTECNISELAKEAIGFKLFMGSTTGDILVNNDRIIYDLLEKIRKTGKVMSVHAEDNNMIRKSEENNNIDHLRNRPLEAEANAIRRLAQFGNNKINICHVTSAQTASSARSAGFTTEVTMHHMLFNATSDGAAFKVNPPLRDEDTREMLFGAFRNGNISMIGSDHAPHREDEKEEYGTAPSGIHGVETTVPIIMDLFKKGMIPLKEVVRMTSYVPAQTFGLKKGRIEKGYDADLSIFDLRSVKKIDGDGLHSKNPCHVYDGMDAIFPDTVILRGEIQIQGGEFCGEAIGVDTVG